MASGPVAGAGVAEHEPLALFLHPGSAAALAATLRGALEAASSGGGNGNSGLAVAEAAGLLFAAAMAPPGGQRTQWCREAVAAGLLSLLLRAAVQISTKPNDPANAARAAAAVCLMAYTAGDARLDLDTQHVRHDLVTGGEPLSEIRARALEALVALTGGGCTDAAMQAVAGAIHTCQDLSSAAADLAAHPGAATALVGALLRCAAAAWAAGPSGVHSSERFVAAARTTLQLLSVMASAVDEPHVEAAEAMQRQQRRLPDEAARCARDGIQAILAEAEAALLRLCAAGGRGGALADDAAAALGFLRRREPPPPLPGPAPLLLADVRRCLVCGRGRGGGVTLRRCSGCRAEGVFYCSVEW
ncbi:hypothetical protein MNEG_2485 [Monoraphidium neglectum]|jgi:hypothetical protein|uniref:Uncharacterized protein n=1 Tax=Monoraphidium neglectum TaxID=145388 RepID=A0A0D2NL46_9CHLO|nr:hypothetical protein MNEG_2485 [Monoraphidium neglectum]KIZ05476.1 hypothetical protein MNEG_2485 [Monoraphidium neglectum]|eukprot:XP_013904495.1 hypothetical protein MNEG_2485 [Monoraphidium neglectum]